MAKIGANYPCFAPIQGDEPLNTLPSYGAGRVIGKLVTANLTANLSVGDMYADDGLAEQINEFLSGTIVMETDDMSDDTAAAIYGATVVDNEVKYNKGDVCPLGCLGYYKSMVRNGVRYYQGYFYPKVRASLGADNAQTKGAEVTFQTTSTTFTVFAPNVGDWRITCTFSNEADAKAWVAEKVGVKDFFAVKVLVSGQGEVSPVGTSFVESGGDLAIQISGVPTAVYDNGQDVTSNISANVYTLSTVTAAHNISVIYSA